MIKIDIEFSGGMVTPVIKFKGYGNLHDFSMYSMRDIGNNRAQAYDYAKDFLRCLRRELSGRNKKRGRVRK